MWLVDLRHNAWNLDTCKAMYACHEFDYQTVYCIGVSTSDDTVHSLATYEKKENCVKVFEMIIEALENKQTVFRLPEESEIEKMTQKQSVKTKEPCMSIEEAVELWNTLADKGFKQVTRMPKSGSQRYEMLKARLKQYTKEDWETCIDKIGKSDLLKANQTGWFHFDWFIKPSNFPKVLDGNYDNRQNNDTRPEKWW